MKYRKGILCLMLLCLLGVFWMSAEASSEKEWIDQAVTITTEVWGRALPEAEADESFYKGKSWGWSYGELIEEADQLAVYQTLASVDIRTYDATNWVRVSLPKAYVFQEAEDIFGEGSKLLADCCRASNAYIYDVGEEYWLNGFSLKVTNEDVTYQSGNWIVKYVRLCPTDYYSGIRSELGITDAALEEAVSEVRTAGTSRYDKVLAAHDLVLKLISYDSAAAENMNNSAYNYAHTITGGLLEKYGHQGVCECYAKLFRLLCTENGIPCILVIGGSKKDTDGNVIADHMWNYVRMDDGQWYLVDTTWDDTLGTNTYFLTGSQTQNGQIAAKHMAVGCFSSVEYEPFSVPELAENAYPKKVTGLTLSETDLKVEADHTSQLQVIFEPVDAEDGVDVVYTSSDSSVAEVNANGLITGKKAGTAIITVSSKQYPDVKTTCTVEVYDHVYGQGTVKEQATCTKTGIMVYTCTNAGCTQQKEETIAKKAHELVSDAAVAATCQKTGVTAGKHCKNCDYKEGYAVIAKKSHIPGKWVVTKKATGTSAGTKVQKCTMCGKVMATSAIDKTYVKLNATGTVPLQKKTSTTAIKIASHTSGDTVKEWTSSNTKIVTVNAKTGKITAQKKTGTATVTVKMNSGATASVKIKVQSGKLTTKTLKATVSTTKLKVGASGTITAKRTPNVITLADKVTFTSSDKKIVSVKSTGTYTGEFTAKKKGNATITVKSGSKKVKIKITVTK